MRSQSVFGNIYQRFTEKKGQRRYDYLMRREKHSLDASHPPTVFRLEMLRAQLALCGLQAFAHTPVGTH